MTVSFSFTVPSRPDTSSRSSFSISAFSFPTSAFSTRSSFSISAFSTRSSFSIFSFSTRSSFSIFSFSATIFSLSATTCPTACKMAIPSSERPSVLRPRASTSGSITACGSLACACVYRVSGCGVLGGVRGE